MHLVKATKELLPKLRVGDFYIVKESETDYCIWKITKITGEGRDLEIDMSVHEIGPDYCYREQFHIGLKNKNFPIAAYVWWSSDSDKEDMFFSFNISKKIKKLLEL